MFTPLILSLVMANNMAASTTIFVAWQISTLQAPPRRQASASLTLSRYPSHSEAA
jgi:hypothetical protein